MEMYAAISIKIKDLDPVVMLHSIVMALKLGSFADNLCKKQPEDLDKLKARAT